MAEPPGGIITPRIHRGCGGTVLWDLSGGWCSGCHAEGLAPDDTVRSTGPDEPYDPDEVAW